MRAFVALEIPAAVVDSFIRAQEELKASGADVKLVERENLHLNLKFLGELRDAEVAEVKSRLHRLSLKGADITVRGVGAFPTSARPRVVWAGIAPEDEPLVIPMAMEVISVLEGIGERDDRPFRPHITLARVRSDRNLRQLTEVLRRIAGTEFGTVGLREFKLKSSTLTPNGPIYRDEEVYPLS